MNIIPEGSLSAKEFWSIIGMRAAPAAIVTARSAEGSAGFLALSVAHLTMDPPTLMVSVSKTTSALGAIREARHFAINFLSGSQLELADIFGGRAGPKGADRFATGQWTTLSTGAPVLEGAVGAIDCVLEDAVERWDAIIAIGRMVAYRREPDARPLIYFDGGRSTLQA